MSYIGILIQIKPQIKVCISLQRLTLKEQTNIKITLTLTYLTIFLLSFKSQEYKTKC